MSAASFGYKSLATWAPIFIGYKYGGVYGATAGLGFLAGEQVYSGGYSMMKKVSSFGAHINNNFGSWVMGH